MGKKLRYIKNNIEIIGYIRYKVENIEIIISIEWIINNDIEITK